MLTEQVVVDQQVRPLFRQLGRTVPTLMPDEAHKPKIAVSGPETIKKVVIKILL